MKKKAVIFGAGSKTRLSIDEILQKYDVLCIADNDAKMLGKNIAGIEIAAPASINRYDFDVIIMCNLTAAVTYDWLEQLSGMGIGRDKIIFDYCVYNADAREEFLRSFSKIVYGKGITGSVAEAGVYQGDFSKRINEIFPDRRLYLFDTFEGFQMRDSAYESFDMKEFAGRFGDTDEAKVLGKMKYPENCIIRKGLFPDTAEGIEDSFCFVNLDMDLYYPTVKGLDFFSQRLSKGGTILVHDYFSGFFTGVKKAVDEWLNTHDEYVSLPIGDGLSIAVVRA